MFIVDAIELKNLMGWLQDQGPRAAQYAGAQFLNDMAFEAREGIHDYLEQSMTIRGKFVKNKIRVWKARGSTPLDHMYSAVGSVAAPRFSGLTEQEYGTPTDRKRFGTMKSRGGTKRRRIKGGYRMKKPFLKPSRFPKRSKWMARYGRGTGFGSKEDAAVFGMLRTLESMRYTKPFIIQGHSSIPDGLYKFSRKKNTHGSWELEALSIFKRKQPRRNPWMSKSIARYLRTAKYQRLWHEALRKEFIFRSTGKVKWRR